MRVHQLLLRGDGMSRRGSKPFAGGAAAAMLLAVSMLVSAQVPAQTSVHAKLTTLAEEITYTSARLDPLAATHRGISGYDGDLPIRTEATRASRIEQLRRWQADLGVITSEFDSSTPLVDRDDAKLLAADLTYQLNRYLVVQRDRKDYSLAGNELVAAIYTQFVALPAVGPGGATQKDSRRAWDEIISRMEKAPAYLAAARKLVTMPCHFYGVIGSKQLAGGLDLFNVALAAAAKSQLAGDTPAYRRFARAQRAIVAAFTGLGAYIDAHVASWPENYALSPEAYEAMLRDEDLLPYTAVDIRLIGQNALAHGWAEQVWVKAASQQSNLALGAASGGGMAPAGGALIGYYGERFAELRKFLTVQHVVTVPGWLGSMQILETPAFLKPVVPTASMEPPRVFESAATGHYWITPPASLAEAAARLDMNEVFDHDRILFLSAHEGIPGHFLQLSIARRHPDFIRKIADSNVFEEGWACYGQEMLVRLGLYGPNLDARLVAANWEKVDGAAAIVDTRLATGEWTPQQGVEFFAAQTDFTHEAAEGAVNLMLDRPGYVVAYAVGRLQIENLMAEYMLKAGAHASLQEFHDRLLSYGSTPLAILGPELLADLGKSADEVRAAANY